MDLRRLKQFVSVAKTGSFGRAAAVLNMTQPSLTRNIRALEEEVGVVLFERGPKGTLLTAAGHKFLPRAQSIIDEASRAITELNPLHAAENQRVKLGLSGNLIFDMAPNAIAQSIHESPDLSLEVTTGNFKTLIESLRRYDIDLVLCLAPDFTGIRGTELLDLRFESFSNETIVPLAPKGHPILERRPTMALLSEERWAIPSQISALYRFESAFHRHGLKIPVQNLNSSSLVLLMRVVRQSQLLTILPARIVSEEVASGELAILETPELHFDFVVALISLQKTHSPAVSRFAGALRAAFR
jgi:DNA-binding transcriptional LysR family regulator